MSRDVRMCFRPNGVWQLPQIFKEDFDLFKGRGWYPGAELALGQRSEFSCAGLLITPITSFQAFFFFLRKLINKSGDIFQTTVTEK